MKERNFLYFTAESGGSSRVADNGTDKIYVDSLDNILQGKAVSFIKMDIEGAELKALYISLNLRFVCIIKKKIL